MQITAASRGGSSVRFDTSCRRGVKGGEQPSGGATAMRERTRGANTSRELCTKEKGPQVVYSNLLIYHVLAIGGAH